MATVQESSAGSIHYQIGATGCSTADATILNMSFDAKAVGDATVTFSAADLLGGDDGSQAVTVSKGSTTVSVAAVAAPAETDTNTNTNKTTKKTTTTSNKNSNINQNSNTAVAALLDPTLLKLEYTADVILDSVINRSKGIAFSGTAEPEATINIVIASDPISATTQSDATGNWMYALTDWLDAGAHTITLSSEKNGQKSAEVKTDFITGTKSKNQIAIGTVLPAAEEAVPEPTTETAKSNNGFMTIAIIAGSIIGLLAIILLIIFISKRRHYLKVTKEITGSMQANSSLSQGNNNEVTGSFLNNQENPLQVPNPVDANAQNQTGATEATSPSSISTLEGKALPVEPISEVQSEASSAINEGEIKNDVTGAQPTADSDQNLETTPWNPGTVAPESVSTPAPVESESVVNNEVLPPVESTSADNTEPASAEFSVSTGASQYETPATNPPVNISPEQVPVSPINNETPAANNIVTDQTGGSVQAVSPSIPEETPVSAGADTDKNMPVSGAAPESNANNPTSLEPEITFDDEHDEENIMNQNNTKKSS